MDMKNATAAGPSYGLLDVIFGSKPQEEPADGQAFKPLMDMIKAMKEQSQHAELPSRTDEETAPGKEGMDYPLVGMPVMFLNQANAMAPPAQAEGETADATAAKAAAVLDPGMVNRMLKEKSLPQLSEAENALLQRVNEKFSRVASHTEASVLGNDPALGALAKADAEQSGDSQAAQRSVDEGSALAMDRRLVKAKAEHQSAAPEKFLSTEAYLQMHDRVGGGKGKEEAPNGVKRMGEEDATIAQKSEQASAGRPTEVVAPMDSQRTGAQAKNGRDLLETNAGAVDPKVKQPMFGASLAHAIRHEAVAVRDVYLPSAEPQQSQQALLGEVNQGVIFNAVKGGGEMRLVIHPEALGELKLKVGTRDGKVDVQVTAGNEEVARMIRGNSRELESALRDQNLTLAKFDVSVAADSPLSPTDTKNSLADQFLSRDQQSSAFAQANSDEGRSSSSSRWDGGGGFGQNRGGAYSNSNEQNASPMPSRAMAGARGPTRDESRRLDVVA